MLTWGSRQPAGNIAKVELGGSGQELGGFNPTSDNSHPIQKAFQI